MRELSQIRDAVVSALAAEGVAALDAYPDQRARRYGCPVAAVAVETAESRTVGFCNYLGEVFDTGAGAPRELYGKQLEAVISIEIRGQRAADCEQGCETAAEVLLGRLPAGLRHPDRRHSGGTIGKQQPQDGAHPRRIRCVLAEGRHARGIARQGHHLSGGALHRLGRHANDLGGPPGGYHR